MIRAERLVVSRPMYAFKPETWRPAIGGIGFELEAVWFKRTKGVLSAVAGTYHPFVTPFGDEPTDGTYESWIAAANDNRYGGRWAATWDGKGLKCFSQPVTPDTAAKWIEFLDAMLKGYPNPPAGWDGWWTFPKEKR